MVGRVAVQGLYPDYTSFVFEIILKFCGLYIPLTFLARRCFNDVRARAGYSN